MLFKRQELKTKIPIDPLCQILRDSAAEVTYERDSVWFRSNGMKTQIQMADSDLLTHDGLYLDQIVVIRTDLQGLDPMPSSVIGALNHFACLSALARTDQATCLVSRLSIFRGEPALKEYVGLVAMTALIQSTWLRQLGEFMKAGEPGQGVQSSLPGAEEPCLWGATDFQTVADYLRKKPCLTTSGETGLTAEFPWEPGAISAGLHHRASLYQLHAARNPLIGNGILSKLELPIDFGEDGDAPEIAAALNASELNATDSAPFFGAWCPVPNSGRVAFVSFQPNLLRNLRMHATMAFWCAARSAATKDLLDKCEERC